MQVIPASIISNPYLELLAPECHTPLGVQFIHQLYFKEQLKISFWFQMIITERFVVDQIKVYNCSNNFPQQRLKQLLPGVKAASQFQLAKSSIFLKFPSFFSQSFLIFCPQFGPSVDKLPIQEGLGYVADYYVLVHKFPKVS